MEMLFSKLKIVKVKKKCYKSKNDGEFDLPIVVLIDDGSASASEIVSAAVSESADIPLIGVKSFGKGTVQSAQNFEDGSNLKFTAFKWLTPKGNWIHKKGISQILKRNYLIMQTYHIYHQMMSGKNRIHQQK